MNAGDLIDGESTLRLPVGKFECFTNILDFKYFVWWASQNKVNDFILTHWGRDKMDTISRQHF